MNVRTAILTGSLLIGGVAGLEMVVGQEVPVQEQHFSHHNSQAHS